MTARMLVVRRYIASTKQVDEKIEQMRSLSNFPVCGNLIKSNLKRAIKMGERGDVLRCAVVTVVALVRGGKG